jgi:hypothetical protein
MAKTKKEPTPKPRNAGTMTESAFWGMVRSGIRRTSRYWKPLTQCKLESRRKYTGVKPLQKWEYQCAHCEKWFMEKEVQVDHIVDAGTLTNADDLKGFIDRLFCEVGGFQTLCKPCHQIKTNSVRKAKKLLKLADGCKQSEHIGEDVYDNE